MVTRPPKFQPGDMVNVAENLRGFFSGHDHKGTNITLQHPAEWRQHENEYRYKMGDDNPIESILELAYGPW